MFCYPGSNDDESFSTTIGRWFSFCPDRDNQKPWFCGRCRRKNYQNKGSLKRHLTWECSGMIPKFICPYCQVYKAKQKSNLVRHIYTVHGDNKPKTPDSSIFVVPQIYYNPQQENSDKSSWRSLKICFKQISFSSRF